MLQAVSRVLDKEMKGQIDQVSMVFISLSFQQFFTGSEVQSDGVTLKRKFTPPSMDEMSTYDLDVEKVSNVLWR